MGKYTLKVKSSDNTEFFTFKTSENTCKLEEDIKQKTSINRYLNENGRNQSTNFSTEKRPIRIPSPG